MSLNELLNDARVAVVGNRVTLVSALLSALYSIGNAVAYAIPAWNEPVASALKSGEFLYLSASALPGILGIGGLSRTKFGLGTLEFYKKTKRHIKTFGSLSPRFAGRAIKKTENKILTGYCQLQGMYLAAKELGQEEAFKEAKREFSNCLIPNF